MDAIPVNPAVDEVLVNPALDVIPVKIEYVLVDTDKQTTRAASLAIGPDAADFPDASVVSAK